MALSGIAVFAGVYGIPDEAVNQMLDNTLDGMPDAMKERCSAHYFPCLRKNEFRE